MRVSVYRMARKRDLFLFVAEQDGLSRVPGPLLDRFGSPEVALTIELNADRTLAREDPVLVMTNLEEQGYHLQLPPAGEQW